MLSQCLGRQCAIFDRHSCRSPSDVRQILAENNFRKKSDETPQLKIFLSKVQTDGLNLNPDVFFWLTETKKSLGFPPPPWPHISDHPTIRQPADQPADLTPGESSLLRSVYFEYRKRISEKSQSGGLQPLVDGAEGFNTTREACKAGAFWAFFFGGGMMGWTR